MQPVRVRYGISIKNFEAYADPRVTAELAYDAEQAGWDGVFVWDHMQFARGFRVPVADPWVLLAAIAMRTERVRIGPLVTPVARRRPWNLARETVTLDHLSGGRLVFGVGLGAPADAEFEDFGEDGDARARAAKLDEGLAILAGLWSGEPFAFAGEHYHLAEMTFLPAPVQRPRIPVWVAGAWPRRGPMRRAAAWDGVAPGGGGWGKPMPLDDLRAMLKFIRGERGADAPFDVVIRGETSGGDPPAERELIAAYAEAGMTWWIDDIHVDRGPFEAVRERVRRGPPGVNS